MRFILFLVLATGCSRTATEVVAPATTPTAATCGLDDAAPLEIKVEVKKPVKHVFDREVCR